MTRGALGSTSDDAEHWEACWKGTVGQGRWHLMRWYLWVFQGVRKEQPFVAADGRPRACVCSKVCYLLCALAAGGCCLLAPPNTALAIFRGQPHCVSQPGPESFVARIAVVSILWVVVRQRASPYVLARFSSLQRSELASRKCHGYFASASALLGYEAGRAEVSRRCESAVRASDLQFRCGAM